jgi:hypothetical protein
MLEGGPGSFPATPSTMASVFRIIGAVPRADSGAE